MLRICRTLAAGTTAGLVLAALVTPTPAATAASMPRLASATGYQGFSNGTLEFVNLLNVPPTDVARVGLGQSAAGVQVPGPLSATATTDQLKQPLLVASKAGKTAYGHASGANVGLADEETARPNVVEDTLVEATSPAPSSATGQLVTLPPSPVATGRVLPSSALANTTADNACVTGKDISRGVSSIAQAEALIYAPNTSVAQIDEVSQTISREALIKQINAAGAVLGPNAGLLSQSTQNLAPITLFEGTPAQLVIKVLAPIQLTAQAGGVAGSAVVSYGTTQTDPTKPILDINGTKLTSQQVFGNRGFVIPLGVADITIGAPAHSLTGLENTSPTLAANGTHASAAADFIRVSVPGRLPVPGKDPLDGPLAPLNAALNPVLAGLAPISDAIQDGLRNAGLNLADLRIGHLEASSTVPQGGILCDGGENPLDESFKDVSATSVVAGETFTYTLRIPNRGSSPITNVTVKDTYDARLEFVSSVPAPASRSGNTLTYNLGTLEPNEFATIVMTFRAPEGASPGTRYSNKAVISGTFNGQPITFPVGVDGPTVVGDLTGDCNLSGSRKYASNTHVFRGETFGYFVNVFNSGGEDCRDVVVKDTLVDGVSFVSCTNGCTRSGQDLTWNLGTIRSGQSLVLGVIVKVTASSGRLPNTAVITPRDGTGGRPSTPGPIVGAVSRPAPGIPAVLTGAADEQLPRTGMSTGASVLGLLLLLSGAALYRRRLSIS